jgi:hypothetical protein
MNGSMVTLILLLSLPPLAVALVLDWMRAGNLPSTPIRPAVEGQPVKVQPLKMAKPLTNVSADGEN